jgi:hypothetical protein
MIRKIRKALGGFVKEKEKKCPREKDPRITGTIIGHGTLFSWRPLLRYNYR